MPRSDERKVAKNRAAENERRVPARNEGFLAEIISAEEVRQVSARGKQKPDRIASRVARRQLNLITTEQLHAAGVGDSAITRRQRRATLHRVHRAVYLYGTDVLLPGAAELAAVLACRPDAWARRRSALSLMNVIPPWQGKVEVTVIGEQRSRSGIAVHRLPDLSEVDRTSTNGIPTVSTELALLEFAAVAENDELERAITESYFLKLVSEAGLRAALERHRWRSGAVALRAELDRVEGPLWTQSEGERRMKLRLREAGLPAPVTRRKVAGFIADFCWPDLRLIVEFDGYQAHGHRYAFERDRKRDQAHIAAGYTVLRFTWRQLENEPLRVIAVIATAIGAARQAA